ncbi:hypothetical protein MBM_01840 [Drepanopeziza brunnea f. sp. 'multigermtubi' MB_m1]|uniref:DUF4211 domain-containing protein n=1 Tax=Marssonina brunnea f. sp. multigermtubi (strain MB_m1) TaxID=1072389 RepID=K1XGE4_MARBU|nr:uncharacterized protein MBM_01840 [Drepanopeziza brunnea f. sp. 'multigermtubi' MB_m1]EKD19888.1 hypothetical protein MBM_01840 [Drepanopeziza brunnea f. sp. 'multigermtubi' MB_m1]
MPPKIERKARRKRQTRLTFEPAPSSSSAPSSMAPAKVRYERAGKSGQTISSPKVAVDEEESSEDEVLGSARRSGNAVDTTPARGKTNLAKKLFKTLPAPGTIPQARPGYPIATPQEDSEYGNVRLPSSIRRSGFLAAEKKSRKPGLEEADSSDGSDVEQNSLTPSGKARGKLPECIGLSEDETPRLTRSRAQRSSQVSVLQGATKSTAAKTVAPKKGRGRPRKAPLPDSSEDEVMLLPTVESNSAVKAVSTKISRKPSPIVIQSDVEEEDEDDDLIVSSPKRSQQPLHKNAQQASDSDSEDVRSSPLKRRRPKMNIVSDEDEDLPPVISPLKRSRKATESDDSDDILPSPLKRPRFVPTQEQSEEEEELPNVAELARRRKAKGKGRALSESPDMPASSGRATRQQVTRRHRTEKEKQMELLKRRRAGESIEELTESESEDDDDDDQNDEFQKLTFFDDDEEEEDEEVVPSRKRAKVRRQRGDSSDEEAGESDFVIEDDEGPLGVPDYTMDIPLEFTHAAHKSPKEHFRDVIEWMVQNKLNPGFARDDPVYRQGFAKLDSEYLGYADSKFVSTQWTAEFTRAVYARPMMRVTKLRPGEGVEILGEAKCQPCNHRKHQPTFALQFTGKAYQKDTLEEIDGDSDSEDAASDGSDDGDKASVNSKGFALPSQEKVWMSGSVCAQNAQQAHTLVHWRWHLNDWVVSSLEEEGHLQPCKLAEREKMTSKKRMKLANKVVDRWGEENKIKTLYRDFKSQLDTARELKAKARGGWR